MKRLVGILMLTMALTSLAACSSKEASNNNALKDGTYEAAGDKWDFGSEEATVVIKDKKIEEIALKRIDTEGKEVDYTAYHAAGGPDLAVARTKLSADMLDKQTYEVDTFTGATMSSGNWKVAVQRALDQAK
jgi:uncharacterized protein with FMN-binding domain